MMTAVQLYQTIFKMLKEPIDGSGHWSIPEVLTRMNLSHDKISVEVPELIIDENTSLTSVVNQANYTLPATIGKIISVRLDGRNLEVSDIRTIDNDAERGMFADKWKTLESGEPKHCYIMKGVLYLVPFPTSAYAGLIISIVHELILTELTDSASSYPFENIAMLKQFQNLLILDCVSWLAGEDGNTQLEASTAARYLRGLDELKSKYSVLAKRRPESLLKEKGNEDDESENYPGNYLYK